MRELKTVVRDGKAYVFPFGIEDETGECAVWIDPQFIQEFSKQDYKVFWNGTYLKPNGEGELAEVETRFRIVVYDNAGNPLVERERKASATTSPEDLVKYKKALYPLLGPATINMFFIGGKTSESGLLGQADFPPFVNGVFVPDEEHPEGATTTPGTWKYNNPPEVSEDAPVEPVPETTQDEEPPVETEPDAA